MCDRINFTLALSAQSHRLSSKEKVLEIVGKSSKEEEKISFHFSSFCDRSCNFIYTLVRKKSLQEFVS